MKLCLMFHSVGLRRHRWAASHIAEDVQPFRAKLEAIRKGGWTAVKFSDERLHDPACRERLICLTFDDGYLDNWVHAAPLLEEYQMPATIFVSTDFVDPRDVLRPRRGLVADAEHRPEDCCAGFLSWPEMRALQSGGLIEICSHAATHTRWPSGPAIVDFWRPGSATRLHGPVHLVWNHDRERKPFYLTEASHDEANIPYGAPVYEHERALVVRRFEPDDQSLREMLAARVAEQGPQSFFADPVRARGELQSIAARWVERHGGQVPGRFESDEEREARILEELAQSRRALENGLGVEMRTLCWPEGGVDPRTLELAREAGYHRFTLPSAWLPSHRQGDYHDLVPRLGSVPRAMRDGVDLGNLSGREFLWYLRRHEGSRLHRGLCRLSIAARLLRARVQAFEEPA